jgi:hypothetical protein
VRDFTAQHEVLLGRQLVEDLVKVSTEGSEARIAKEFHGMGLTVARLPAYAVRPGTIPEALEPAA